MYRTRIVDEEHGLRRGDDDGKMSLRAFVQLVNRAIAQSRGAFVASGTSPAVGGSRSECASELPLRRGVRAFLVGPLSALLRHWLGRINLVTSMILWW
jgi:hypothetical protein